MLATLPRVIWLVLTNAVLGIITLTLLGIVIASVIGEIRKRLRHAPPPNGARVCGATARK